VTGDLVRVSVRSGRVTRVKLSDRDGRLRQTSDRIQHRDVVCDDPGLAGCLSWIGAVQATTVWTVSG